MIVSTYYILCLPVLTCFIQPCQAILYSIIYLYHMPKYVHFCLLIIVSNEQSDFIWAWTDSLVLPASHDMFKNPKSIIQSHLSSHGLLVSIFTTIHCYYNYNCFKYSELCWHWGLFHDLLLTSFLINLLFRLHTVYLYFTEFKKLKTSSHWNFVVLIFNMNLDDLTLFLPL